MSAIMFQLAGMVSNVSLELAFLFELDMDQKPEPCEGESLFSIDIGEGS
jgi:hypothetical protein